MKAGRKGGYTKWLTEDSLIILQDWARQGLTDEQIFTKMGIGRTAFYEWKSKYSEFANALKKTKDIVDAEVENKLFKRAMGYEVEEEEIKEVRNDDGEMIVISRKRTKKHIAPDVTAIIFWLKNRRPNEWREKQEIINKNINAFTDMQALSDIINKPVKERKIEDFE